MFWSIKKLEEKLLSLSTSDDVVAVNPDGGPQEHKQTLNPEEIKKEISVLSRILINGYCGWPFHSKLLKWSVLLKLNKLFDAAAPMPSAEFLEKIGAVLGRIPDNHLSVRLGDRWIRHKNRKYSDVGANIAKAEDFDYRIEKHGDFAVIALSKLSGECVKSPEKFLDWAKSAIDSSCAVIVDLRGNGGGDSSPLDMLAKYLYGAKTPSVKKSYLRGTSEGAILRGADRFNTSGTDMSKDPFLFRAFENVPYPKFSGVEKPIYILTDGGVCSSAELFIACLLHHPFVKRVGANTAGCELYGNISEAVLPNTGIIMTVGNEYRELEAGDIELKGYAPDIRVPNGGDALAAAKAEFEKFTNLQRYSYENNIKSQGL